MMAIELINISSFHPFKKRGENWFFVLKLYKKWEVEIKRMNFIKEKINKLSFDKKTVIKVVGILVVFAVAIGTIVLIGHNGKTTSSKEVQTTTVQETKQRQK